MICRLLPGQVTDWPVRRKKTKKANEAVETSQPAKKSDVIVITSDEDSDDSDDGPHECDEEEKLGEASGYTSPKDIKQEVCTMIDKCCH